MEAILSPIIKPMINLLFAFYSLVPGHDFGVAVILLTAVIRFALWPLAQKQLIGQREINKIQPEANKLKEKHGKDPQKYQAALMELYKEKEINPFSSCFLTLIQLPFLFALFYVFIKFQSAEFLSLSGDKSIIHQIYPFVQNFAPIKSFISGITKVDTQFLGLIDLAKPYLPLAIIAGGLQFLQTKMITPKKQEGGDAAVAMTAQMVYFFPLLTIVIAITLPAALPLYWIVTTAFAILQQYLVMHHDVEILEEKSEKGSKKSRRNR